MTAPNGPQQVRKHHRKEVSAPRRMSCCSYCWTWLEKPLNRIAVVELTCGLCLEFCTLSRVVTRYSFNSISMAGGERWPRYTVRSLCMNWAHCQLYRVSTFRRQRRPGHYCRSRIHTMNKLRNSGRISENELSYAHCLEISGV